MAHSVTMLRLIEHTAQRILDTQPDATLRIRLLHNVLRLSAQDEVLLVMSLAIFYRRSQVEEVTLVEHFGTEWLAYAARTKAFIPFVH
jgi:hypothetical protein